MDNRTVQHTLQRVIKAISIVQANELDKLSLFESSCILHALPVVPELAGVRKTLARTLHAALNTNSLPDLATHFCILTSLWQYDQTMIAGKHLAVATKRLIQSEVRVGGPYAANGEPDFATNICIAFFMRTVSQSLPQLTAFIEEKLSADKPPLTDNSLRYILAYTADNPVIALHATLQPHDTTHRTPANLALELIASRHSSSRLRQQQFATMLCARQQKNGLWNDASPLVVSAFAAHALTLYRLATNHPRPTTLERHRTAIISATKRAFAAYKEPVPSTAFKVIDHIEKADSNFEISLLAELCNRSLQHAAQLTPKQRITLGTASICGWLAYTIYDDFLDGETNATMLPIANIASRLSVTAFHAVLPTDESFSQDITDAFAAMDQANAWEVAHCRMPCTATTLTIGTLPHYGMRSMLAMRSYAHILAPLAVLRIHNPHLPPSVARYMTSAFRHYLIARQLHDDLEDWVSDIQHGQATYVTTAILRGMRIKPGSYGISSLVVQMRHHFRTHTSAATSKIILEHTKKSREAFKKCKLFKPTGELYDLIDRLEHLARHILDEHGKIEGFCKNADEIMS